MGGIFQTNNEKADARNDNLFVLTVCSEYKKLLKFRSISPAIKSPAKVFGRL